jgi:hypothetical protein
MGKLIEPITTAILAFLTANLPTKLTAVTAEYGDGVAPPAPSAYYGYLKDPRLPDFQFPAVVVGALPTTKVGSEVGGAGDFQHNLWVSYVQFDTSGDPVVLDKQMKRAGEAIARLIEAHPTAVGDRWEVVSLRYGQPAYLGSQENAERTGLFQEMPVVVRVMSYEVLT